MRLFRLGFCIAVVGSLSAALSVLAFPPAPHHLVYGLVRDQMGEPLASGNAEVILESSTGVQMRTRISPNLGPGLNYRLSVPMDAGTRPELYKPTALMPTMPFRLKVKIGAVNFLPMRASGTNLLAGASFSSLGQPAESTRFDLTLGEDTDNDGLPDAWERALISMRGRGETLGDIDPSGDSDGDGISNLNEYLAGTYAFDPADGFRLSLVPQEGAEPQLEFMVLTGRTYTVYSSIDLETWAPIEFTVPAAGPSGTRQADYRSKDIRMLRVQPLLPDGKSTSQCLFKVGVQ